MLWLIFKLWIIKGLVEEIRKKIKFKRPDDPGCPNKRPDDPGCPNKRPDDPGCPNKRPYDPACPNKRPDDPGCPNKHGNWVTNTK